MGIRRGILEGNEDWIGMMVVMWKSMGDYDEFRKIIIPNS